MNKLFIKKNKSKLVSGFTLIEIMVATTIFIIVMIMGMGSLISSSSQVKQARKLGIAMDNVSFAMENMTRTIRMATSYVSNGPNSISFTPSGTSNAKGYRYVTNSGNGSIQKQDNVSNAWSDITSPEVDIEMLKFFVNGEDDDEEQPSVYILIKGNVNIEGEAVPFAIQTLASQRSTE